MGVYNIHMSESAKALVSIPLPDIARSIVILAALCKYSRELSASDHEEDETLLVLYRSITRLDKISQCL